MTSPSRHSLSLNTTLSDRPSYTVLSTIRSPQTPLVRSRGTPPHALDVPGPGSYELRNEWKGNAISWRPAIKPPHRDDLPPIETSPVRSQLSSRATSMGTKLGTKLVETPGPGTYSPRSSYGKISPRIACTFGEGHGSGGWKNLTEAFPGPGTYDPTPAKGATIALKSRLNVSSFDGPGPGQYSLKSPMGTGRSITIGEKC
jgi:hypothetical protein